MTNVNKPRGRPKLTLLDDARRGRTVSFLVAQENRRILKATADASGNSLFSYLSETIRQFIDNKPWAGLGSSYFKPRSRGGRSTVVQLNITLEATLDQSPESFERLINDTIADLDVSRASFFGMVAEWRTLQIRGEI